MTAARLPAEASWPYRAAVRAASPPAGHCPRTARPARRWPACIALALVAISAPACGDDEVVDVEVPFRFGAGDCATAGVVSVRGALYDFESRDPVAAAEAACATGRLRIPDVPTGTYSIVLEGLDGRPCVTHAARLDGQRVGGGATTMPSLRLGLTPRPLELRWHLPDGLTCASVGLRQVEAVVRVGDAPPAHAVFLCEGGRGLLPSVPAGPAHVVVLGLDAEGTSIARGEAEYGESTIAASACDAHIGVDVMLEGCASAGCP